MLKIFYWKSDIKEIFVKTLILDKNIFVESLGSTNLNTQNHNSYNYIGSGRYYSLSCKDRTGSPIKRICKGPVSQKNRRTGRKLEGDIW